MKKVRFESPKKRFLSTKMNDVECHSPRPFLERRALVPPAHSSSYNRVLPYSKEPTQMFEASNSSPYPFVKKTQLCSEERPKWCPSNELELSILDTSYHEPREALFCKPILKNCENNTPNVERKVPPVLSSIENKSVTPTNILSDNGFFIRRGNVSNLNVNINNAQDQLNRLYIDKENDPLGKKAEIMKSLAENVKESSPAAANIPGYYCTSYHNLKNTCSQQVRPKGSLHQNHTPPNQLNILNRNYDSNHCHCLVPAQPNVCSCCENHLPPRQTCFKKCTCETPNSSPKMNAVDKKTMAIEKFERNKNTNTMEIEKQMNIKEKREPTVSDLFKIIKLQNEQLQLLQEKVDKFIMNQKQTSDPVQNCLSEHVSIQAVESEQHKISIGVMTSFEMVRTSTIVNKEVLKGCDTQIQCNRSQISIKEVIKAPNANFLDGISRIDKHVQVDTVQKGCNTVVNGKSACDGNEDKTYNELSLYNVQVDTTTPLISPEQSLYLDVRDYSDSDADSDDQSNVGWTYYNKVMTHVNGMLQDSDMPSSASALCRNTRQQMQVQMQIDKTNVSVMKRVKFGDDPLGLHQPHIHTPTDTSLKMNQLAAKYLKNGPVIAPKPTSRPTAVPPTTDMSFATRNYMEKHNLLQGIATSSKSPVANEMPRFLDITALKQQPKLL